MDAVTRRFHRLRPLASALALPLGLLVFRQVALFIPVPGALSTLDWVAFWSTGAYGYFALLFVFTSGIIVAILKWGLPDESEISMGVAFWGGVGYLAASGVLLPVDGWAHLYMPFVAHVAAVKVLLIQPWLVSLAGVTLALHILLAVSGRGFAHREVNKLLLVLAVIAGLLQFSLQARGLEDARRSLSLSESWTTDDARSGEPQDDSAEKPANGEVQAFLDVWAAHLGSVRDCGVNLVEKASSASCLDPGTIAHSSPWAHPQAPWPTNVLLWIACGFVVLVVLCERVWPRDQSPGPIPPGTAEAFVGSWTPISVSFGKRMRIPPALAVAAVVSALALAAATRWSDDLVLGLSAAGFCAAWLTLGFFLLSRLGFFDQQRAGSRFILSRDRHGSRTPGSLVLRTLRGAPDRSKMLSTLPAEWRLVVTAVGGVDLIDNEERKTFEGGNLERYPHATWLTRVDIACAKTRAASSAAARSLPAELWPRAVRRLLQSKQVEARMAGVRCHAARREALLRLCVADDNAGVRQAAWERVQETITPADGAGLVRSQYQEVRATAATSGKLSATDLMRLAEDPSPAVREAAIRSGKLSRNRLLSVCEQDSERSVRDEALRALGTTLSAGETLRLSYSKFTDVRSRALSSGQLRHERLRALLRFDPDAEVRQAAWQLYFQHSTAEEVEALLDSGNREARPRAARRSELSPQRQIQLCACDWQAEVRQAAWESLRQPLTAADVATLGSSAFGDTRLRAIGTGLLARERLVEICAGDCLLAVRRAAWERITAPLSREEAEALGGSPFGDVRLAAVRSDLLPDARLIELRRDADGAVRAAARELLATRSATERMRVCRTD